MPLTHVKVQYLSEVTSTNDVVRDFAISGADDLTAVQADVQTAGRGRRGRSWSTIPHESMALSILVREANAPHLPLITALAVWRTVSTWLPEARIKWPNDVLLGGKKLSGILVERFDNAGNPFYVVGTGLNVGLATDDFWKEMPMATALNKEGADVSIQTVIELYTSYFEQMLTHYRAHGWDDFLQNLYQNNCSTLGENVTWVLDGERTEGVAKSIDEHGTLILETVDGTHHKILSGDIVKDATPNHEPKINKVEK